MQKSTTKIHISNRKAFHDFTILEKYEAGVVLSGCEVKSVRSSQADLKDSYAQIKNGELWLMNCYIAPFSQGNRSNLETKRNRKLLLHKKEIQKLIGKVEEKGFTLIPLNMYFSKNKVKVEIGLAKAKKLFDKRKTLKEKAIKKDIEQSFREKYK
jgi:SsrA-binding protein